MMALESTNTKNVQQERRNGLRAISSERIDISTANMQTLMNQKEPVEMRSLDKGNDQAIFEKQYYCRQVWELKFACSGD